MSIYFSTHKKKKTFPFAMFGYTALLVWTGLFLYLWQKGFSFNNFLINGPNADEKNILGFAIIVSSFLFYFLGLGIAREIKSKFKFPLYMMQFLFLTISVVSGYFISSIIFIDTIKYFMIIGALYFITLIVYLALQHRVYSRYYSRIVIVITSLPVLPFLYYLFRLVFGHNIIIASKTFSFDNMVLYTLLFTLLLYNTVNSIYLTYINRRVY